MEPVSLASVIAAYRRYASIYDALFGLLLEPGRRALARAVAAAPACGSVLEVGVGTGLTLARYPARSRLTGIDVSDAMLGHARRRAAALHGRAIELHLMSAEQMSFADASFDCVTLPYVLSVTPDPARLVREVRRVCRPGGTILVLNHFSGAALWRPLEWLLRKLARRIGFRADASFDELIGAHDWRIERVRPVNLLRLSRLVTLRNS